MFSDAIVFVCQNNTNILNAFSCIDGLFSWPQHACC